MSRSELAVGGTYHRGGLSYQSPLAGRPDRFDQTMVGRGSARSSQRTDGEPR